MDKEKKKKPTVARGALLVSTEKTIYEGKKLRAEVTWLDDSLKCPVIFDGERCGEAKIYHNTEGDILCNIEFLPEWEATILATYAFPKGRIEELVPDTQEVKRFYLESVILSVEQPFEGALPLIEHNELQIAKEFLASELERLQKKGWSSRRIKRHFLDKHKILLQ